MGILDRFKRTRSNSASSSSDDNQVLNADGTIATILRSSDHEYELPGINQRVTIGFAGRPPVPSRVDDRVADGVVLADPGLPLEASDVVTMSWESEGGWFGLETEVTEVVAGTVPSIVVASDGRLQRYAHRRKSIQREISVPLELRVAVARTVKTGQVLATRTVELGDEVIRFVTSAPLAPGDFMEARVDIPHQAAIRARVKVIRMDTSSGAVRQTCTVVLDEILRSDRTRLEAFLEHSDGDLLTRPASPAPETQSGDKPASSARTSSEMLLADLEPPLPRNQG